MQWCIKILRKEKWGGWLFRKRRPKIYFLESKRTKSAFKSFHFNVNCLKIINILHISPFHPLWDTLPLWGKETTTYHHIFILFFLIALLTLKVLQLYDMASYLLFQRFWSLLRSSFLLWFNGTPQCVR